MAENPAGKTPEPKMEPAALFREEVFTDRKVGTIRRMTPVKSDGSPDAGRRIIYVGEAQLLTNVGALPLSFEIKAASLQEAVSQFGDTAKRAVDKAMQELQEMRRQAASSIVVPQAGAGGLGPGGLPGGGKIKLP
jgi:hypothetical protein